MSIKRSHEEFVKIANELRGKEYSVIGSYVNSNTKIEFYHEGCNSTFFMRAANFLRGDGCSNCCKPRKRTHEDFLRILEDTDNNEYEALGIYKNANTIIKLKHKPCGHIYDCRPHNFIARNQRCPECFEAVNKQPTNEKFLKRLAIEGNNEYTVKENYLNNNTKMTFTHKKCGYEWLVASVQFFGYKHKCPQCSGNVRNKTTDYFKKEVQKHTDGEYTVLGEFINGTTKIKMKHGSCGHEYDVNPASFLSGARCPDCFGCFRKTTLQFKQEVFDLVGNEYEVLGEYQNNRTRLAIMHNICSQTSNLTPSDFSQGGRCLYCKSSKGEKAVFNYFYKKEIPIEQEFKFEDCKYKRELPFDFALFSQNNELKLLIEYDGEQHFIAKSFYGGQEGLEKTQIRDGIKTQYCIDNNIPLLRIPYWDFDNIESIINNKLIELNINKL